MNINNHNYILLYNNMTCKNKPFIESALLKLDRSDDKFVHNKHASVPYSSDYLNDTYKLKLLEKLKKELKNQSTNKEYSNIDNLIFTDKIDHIQSGELGLIRNARELSTSDLKTLIDFQLSPTTPEDIEQIINSYPKDKQELACKALNKLTQWGNLNSVDSLYFYLKDQNTQGIPVYNDLNPSLTTTIKYFVENKKLYDKPLSFSSKNGVLLLDQLTLQRLEQDEEFRNTAQNFKIACPEAWINGINVFNQSDDLKTKLDTIMSNIEILKEKYSNLNDIELIEKAINLPIIEKLNKIGIENVDFIPNYNTYYPNNYIPSFVDIAYNLNQHDVTIERIQKILKEFKPKERAYIREILAHGLNINSPKSMNLKLKELHKKIIENNGGNDIGLYFYVPRSDKSYSTVLMQYMLVNNISPDRVVLAKEMQDLPDDCKTFVILDDYAGTGNSLVTAAKHLQRKIDYNNLNSKIIITPMLATKSGLENCKSKTTTIAQDLFFGFKDSEYFKSLSDDDKRVIENLLGYKGYEDTAACVAFPYMAPDNNCELFTLNFAELFTLHGKGIKNLNF